MQGRGEAGDCEVAVVGEEEVELNVRGEVVEDHLAVGGFPAVRGGFRLVASGPGKAGTSVL